MLTALLAAPAAQAWQAGNNASSYAPAITTCPDLINPSVTYHWLAFTGLDGQLNLIKYPEGAGDNTSGQDITAAQYYLGTHAAGAPALTCTIDNQLVMAWRDSSNHIVLSNFIWVVGHGIQLINKMTWPETTDASPAITGSLDQGAPSTVVAWAGTDPAHHINLAFVNSDLTEGGKFTTSDYTRPGAGVGVGRPANGPDGLGYYVGFLASSGTPYIFMGFFPPDGSTVLNSVATTDYSPYVPAVSGTRVLWKGYTNNLIYQGTFNGTSNLGSSAPFSDTTPTSPAEDDYGCATAYLGTNSRIYYDTEPYFGCHDG
jgi:hypothetical protein